MTGLFGGAPKAPAIQPPAPMPVPVQDDELARQQQRRLAATAANTQSGRASTILSDQGTTNKLGG